MGTDIFIIIKVIMKCACIGVGEQGEKLQIKLDVTSAWWEDAIPFFTWLCSSVFLLPGHSVEQKEKQRMKCQTPHKRSSAELRYLKIHGKNPKKFQGKKKKKVFFSKLEMENENAEKN